MSALLNTLTPRSWSYCGNGKVSGYWARPAKNQTTVRHRRGLTLPAGHRALALPEP